MPNLSYIDTHCHIDMILSKIDVPDYNTLKTNNYPSGYEGCVTAACAPESLDHLHTYLENPGVYGAAGLHPHEAKYYNDEIEQKIIRCVSHEKVMAWGECGLDFHYNHSPADIQKKVFIRQLTAAQEHGMPIVIHSREAERETLEIMKEHISKDWKIHLHCFTGSPGMALSLLDHFPNLGVGITGAVTFKNSENIQETVKFVPLDRLLGETDSPFMAPVPHRGKVCHSGYIPLILEKIASLKQIETSKVYSQLRENTRQIYGI